MEQGLEGIKQSPFILACEGIKEFPFLFLQTFAIAELPWQQTASFG